MAWRQRKSSWGKRRELLEIKAEICASTAKRDVFQAAWECSSAPQTPLEWPPIYRHRHDFQLSLIIGITDTA